MIRLCTCINLSMTILLFAEFPPSDMLFMMQVHGGFMPKATVLCGSARTDGVTRAMCSSATEHLRDMGWRADTILLSDLDIRHCTDCGSCRHTGCVIWDDMDVVYKAFQSSDMVVLASPIHFSGPSSLIKTAMDRFQPWWFDGTLPHPSVSVGLLCGGSDRPFFGNTVSIFRAFSITTGMEWRGHLEISGTDRKGSEGVPEKVSSFLDSVVHGVKGEM